MLRHAWLLAIPWALLASCPSSLQAQATIIGTVTDHTSGLPLADAQVFFGDRTTPAITNAFGKYRIEGVTPGRDWLMIRRIGYAPVRRTVLVSGDSVHTVYIRLDPLPVTLPEIEVRIESGFQVRRLQDFWQRHSTAWGRFITREDLDKFGGPFLSTLVRMYLPRSPVSHWDVADYYSAGSNGFEQGPAFSSRFAGLARCPPAVSINGSTPWGAQYVDDYSPREVEALEIYKPGMRVPNEFQSYGQAASCGLVVLWLR